MPYLKIIGIKLGQIINFIVRFLRQGIKRIILYYLCALCALCGRIVIWILT